MEKRITAAEFAAAMTRALAQNAQPWPGAVAVSGGGDSLALMLLLADWAAASSQKPPVVLTVDHGLMPGAKRTAEGVVRLARAHGLFAHKLVWRGAKPKADIEAAARAARYALMGEWCEAHGIGALYVAHTLEDQAETFLLRLARGSGLDGLAAMRPVSPYPVPGFAHLRLVRPLLETSRESLRRTLKSRGVDWADDPMNADPRFARVRLRQSWPLLDGLGLSTMRIAVAAAHLARARDALDEATGQFLDEACRFETGRAVLDGARLAEANAEIGLRALAQILSRVSGEPYRPRFERLERLYLSVRKGDFRAARTLHGCRIGRAPKAVAQFGPSSLIVTREGARKPPKKRGVAAGA